jgi:hypothetical protein
MFQLLESKNCQITDCLNRGNWQEISKGRDFTVEDPDSKTKRRIIFTGKQKRSMLPGTHKRAANNDRVVQIQIDKSIQTNNIILPLPIIEIVQGLGPCLARENDKI